MVDTSRRADLKTCTARVHQRTRVCEQQTGAVLHESHWLEILTTSLRAEEDTGRSEHARRAALRLSDRVAVGFTWSPLEVDSLRSMGSRTLVRLRAPRGIALHDGIRSGDPIVLGTPTTVEGLPGWVSGAEGRIAEVVVSGDPSVIPDSCAVSLRFDPSTFQRYRKALLRARDTPSPLREVLLGTRPGGTLDDHPRLPVGRLNAAQHAAGSQALEAAELALIHGPPGTGKTELVAAMLAALVAFGDRPWALADSNAAVDHLALRAASRGLRVVRLGHPMRVGGPARELTVDHRIAAGPHAKALALLDRDLGRLRSTRSRRAELRQLLAERRGLSTQARSHVLAGAQVIASTLGTLARVAPDLEPPHTAIIDEATQAVEPAVWTAVPYVKRLILVGDPCQLGPVVLDRGSPLERSVVQRLLDQGELPMPMLEVQHRMDERLQTLVQPVYGESWRAHPTIERQVLADLSGVQSTPLTTTSVLWVDTAGAGLGEARDPVSQSLYNEGELAVVVLAVTALCEAGVPADAIGVIAPYSAQVGRLRTMLPDVEVATVNAFQGREKEAIVCTFVRSNDAAELGFVSDGRRLTVALSRARRLLIAVGDSATLASHPRFADLFDHLAERGELSSVFEPPWDTVLG